MHLILAVADERQQRIHENRAADGKADHNK